MSALDRVQMSDLDEEQQQVAELIGLDNYKRLVNVFGGLSIYIPKADAWERMARDEQIRAEFDGYNFKELAGRYGLTEVRIRSIVSDKMREVRARPYGWATIPVLSNFIKGFIFPALQIEGTIGVNPMYLLFFCAEVFVMTFDAGTWWLAVLLLGFVTAGLVYLLKRSLFGRIDKLDESMKEISENSVKKSDYESTVQALQADIKQIRADYTPRAEHRKVLTSAGVILSKSRQDYITKEDFFREQAKTDRKLDRIMDILLEMKGDKKSE